MSLGCGPSMWEYHRGVKSPVINHPDTIPVWVDKNFNQANKEAIARSIDEWNFVLNGQIRLSLADTFDGKEDGLQYFHRALETNQGVVILNLSSDDEEIDNVPASVLAFVPGVDAHVMFVIRNHIGGRELKDIVLHEFGHILGASHTIFPSLMYPAYSSKQYPCVDKITAMQIAEAQELDVETLRYCRTPTYQ